MVRLINVCIAAMLSLSCWGAERFVSPSGSAANSGTALSPWDLTTAGSAAAAGDIVHLAAGVYSQRLIISVSGNSIGGFITFVGDTGAIIDGTGIPLPTTGDFSGLVHLNGQRYIRIEGLEIRNWKTTNANASPVGIYVHSAGGITSDIDIVGNHVHDIWQRSANAGAHGIGVYGNNATAISNLRIKNNEVDHCQVGWSESVVVNGNINGFEISDNRVHHNNNIGIDCIGYEGVAPSGSPDYVRNGLVARNTVYTIHSNGYDATSANPAYATNDDAAGGIYVDGARDTIIERNLVYDCDIGIEIGAEHTGDRNSSNVTVRNNLIHSTIQGCIQLGGYSAGLSWTENCLFIHNTCWNADTKNNGYGLIVLAKSRNCVFSHNLLIAQNRSFVLSASLGLGSITGHSFDWNLYWRTNGTPQFQLISSSFITGLDAFRTASGQDAHSLQLDPLVVSLVGTLDFRLQALSPAIDAGNPAFVIASGETDLAAGHRLQTTTDIGAYEYTAGGIDITAPVLADITADSLTDSGARIVWSTNEAATTQLEYGITSTYGLLSPRDASLVTAHHVRILGLTAGTVYHFRVLSEDAAGNLARGPDHQFTTSTTTSEAPPLPANDQNSNNDGGTGCGSGVGLLLFSLSFGSWIWRPKNSRLQFDS